MRKTKNNQKIDAENPSMKKTRSALHSAIAIVGINTRRTHFSLFQYKIFYFCFCRSTFYSILGSITARCKQALRFTAKLQHTHSKNITSDEFRLDLTEFVIFVVDSFDLTFFSVEKPMNHSIEFGMLSMKMTNRSKSVEIKVNRCFYFRLFFVCFSLYMYLLSLSAFRQRWSDFFFSNETKHVNTLNVFQAFWISK